MIQKKKVVLNQIKKMVMKDANINLSDWPECPWIFHQPKRPVKKEDRSKL